MVEGIASPERKARAIAEKAKREVRSFLFCSRILNELSVICASFFTAKGINGRTIPRARITFLNPPFEEARIVKGEIMQTAAKMHKIA